MNVSPSSPRNSIAVFVSSQGSRSWPAVRIRSSQTRASWTGASDGAGSIHCSASWPGGAPSSDLVGRLSTWPRLGAAELGRQHAKLITHSIQFELVRHQNGSSGCSSVGARQEREQTRRRESAATCQREPPSGPLVATVPAFELHNCPIARDLLAQSRGGNLFSSPRLSTRLLTRLAVKI